MAMTEPLHQETNLIGRIVNEAITTTAIVYYAQFTDSKTGVARTPQSTTLWFTLDKDNSKFEIIKASSHTTTNGITTINVATNGRSMPLYGVGVGSATGLSHPVGAQIGCVDIHWATEVLGKWMDGTEASGGTALRVGDETDSDIYFYFQNADGAKPYIKYDKTTNQFVYANDGASEVAMGGAGTITAGTGLGLAASVMSIDLADTDIFVSTSSGAADEDKIPLLNASGNFADGFVSDTINFSTVTTTTAELNKLAGASANVTATNLNTLTGGVVSDADALHTHPTIGLLTTRIAGENIDGSATPKAVFISAGTTVADTFPLQMNEVARSAESNFYGVNYICQTFVTSTFQTVVTRVDFALEKHLSAGGAVAGNVLVSVYAVDGARKPTGAALATKTYTADSILVTYEQWITFTFAAPIAVSPNTEYAVTVTAIGGDATHYIEAPYGASNSYAAGTTWTSNDAGTTWSAGPNDYIFKVWGYEEQTAGRIYMSDKDEPFRGMVDGFVTSNTTTGNAATFLREGVEVTFAGLTAGATYYVDSTAGAITATPGGLKVGKASSTTKMVVDLSGGFVEKTVIDTPSLVIGTTTFLQYSTPFNCGFKPSRVELQTVLSCDQAGGADARTYQFNGRYVSSLYGVYQWLVPANPAGGVSQGALALQSAASQFAAANTAGNTTTTWGGFLLTNTGLYSTITVAGAGSGGGSVQAIFYR